MKLNMTIDRILMERIGLKRYLVLLGHEQKVAARKIISKLYLRVALYELMGAE